MTVLIVDDEPDIAALLVCLMDLEGYHTATTASGAEALELARKLRPDAVVLDLSLPDVDGVQVLRRLKGCEETASIPVIVVSAYLRRLSAADRSLLHAVFEKPFDLDQIAAAVAHSCAVDHSRDDAVPASVHLGAVQAAA